MTIAQGPSHTTLGYEIFTVIKKFIRIQLWCKLKNSGSIVLGMLPGVVKICL